MSADPREVARWARIVTANRLICVRSDDWMNCGDGGTHHGGADFCTPIDRLADAFEEVAMGVEAREVARQVVRSVWSYEQGNVRTGFVGPGERRQDTTATATATRVANLHPEHTMPDLLTAEPPPRRCAIPLLVELCAGTAALSLRLERDKARPPVSRMGAKTGYADVILALAGLKPGDKAAHYLWCEPDDGVRLLLHAYRDADLAREAARIIRSWADEDPRALWERLRAEGPAQCPPVDAREVGRWAITRLWSINPEVGWSYCGPGKVAKSGITPFAARWTCPVIAERFVGGLPATIHDDARTLPVPDPMPEGALAFMDPPYSDVPAVVPPMLAAERLPLGPVGRAEGDAALIAVGLDCLREPVAHLRVSVLEVLRAAGVEPQVLDSVVERVVIDVVDDLVWSQVASDVLFHHKAVFRDDPSIVTAHPVPILGPPLAVVHAASGGHLLPLRGHLRDFAFACEALTGAAPKFTKALAWADSTLAPSRLRVPRTSESGAADLARDFERHCRTRVEVRQDTNTRIKRPGGKTTGYAHAFGRDEVVAVARKWADAGARVMISEAVPIPELVADGWHAVEITAMRVGQKRTFSKQQREWITCNFAPDDRTARTCARALERQEAASEAPAVEQVGLFGGGQ